MTRRLAILALLGLLAIGPSFGAAPQHEAPAAEKAGEHAAHGSEAGAHDAHADLGIWKWANFLLIAGLLGWMIKKNAGPFFEGRTREIRKQMMEAQEIRAEADRRTAEVEARLANLDAEIAALREEALAEQQAEGERFRQRAAEEMAKIQAHAEAEIDAAGKQARLELRRYTAQLAVGLAERKIRAGMTPATQNALVDSFVQGIERPTSRAQAH